MKKELDYKEMTFGEFEDAVKTDKSLATAFVKDITTAITSNVDWDILRNRISAFHKGIDEIGIKLVKTVADNLNTKFVEKCMEIVITFEDILKAYEGIDKLSGEKVEILNRYNWVMPFEYPKSEILELDKLENKNEFNEIMNKHFSTRRVQRMYNEIIRHSKKDKKVIMKQIKQNYFLGNYAICIVSLVTFLEGLSLEFLDSNSEYQGKSYNVFEDILNYYSNKEDTSVQAYQQLLQIKTIVNFYKDLFEDITKLISCKSNTSKRHPISHGAGYINDKIEVLRLSNTIILLQKLFENTDLKGQFEGYKNHTNKSKIQFTLKECI